MLRHAPAKARGFTLIEVMIAIVVMGLLIALSLPSFNEWIQSTKIRNAAEAMSAGLKLARSEAVRHNASVQFTTGTGSSWTVSCVNVVNDRDAVNYCPDNIQTRATGEGSASSIRITPPTDIAAGTPIVFNSLGRMSSPTPAGGATFIAFNFDSTAVSSARNLRVTVDIGGNVRLCDPAVGDTDSRKCPP